MRKRLISWLLTLALLCPAVAFADGEEPFRVSYLGPAGTYTESAAQAWFGTGATLLPQATVNDAIADVLDGASELAVIPQENTLGGAVVNYIDALIAAETVFVVGEVVLPISQTLMGVPGATLADIRTVCSHAQGLTQSAAWRAEHLPDAAAEEMASTAAAASFVAEQQDKSIAAVAAPGAAALYGLEVLAENVQLSDANKTRFYVLSREPVATEGATHAVFVASCAGSRIDDILIALHDAGLEIVALHDRPEGSGLGMYHYVIEVEDQTGVTDAQLAAAGAQEDLRFVGRFDVLDVSQGTGLLAIPAPVRTGIYIEGISKHGNIALPVTCQDFLDAGYRFGDLLTLSFLDQTLTLPFGSNYSDVDTGEIILGAREKDVYITLAVNMGDFATSYGVAVKTSHEDGSFSWDYAPGVEGPIPCTVSMSEPGGYYSQYVARQLSYTDERDDYPQLTDEQFANFRCVETSGMGKNTLYRAASPVNPEHNRNLYADAAMKNSGVTVILDLADDEATLLAYPGYEKTYFASVEHLALNMGVDFTSADYREKLAAGLRFLADTPGVYAIHCTEGKDRSGIVCALLESLMGATLDELLDDYMLSFSNYYGLTPEDDRYAIISQGNALKNLQRFFGTEDLEAAELSALAEDYIRALGLSEEELLRLKTNLGMDNSLAVPAA